MKKYLIVIDFQNDFIDGALGTDEAKAIVPNVVSKIKEYYKSKDSIYATRDTHFDNYLETEEGKMIPVKHCIRDTEGWQLYKDIIKYIPNTRIDDKFSFASNLLYQQIHLNMLSKKIPDNDVQFEFCGLVTDICVLSNVMIFKAMFPFAKIVVDSSCCAGTTPEKHNAALALMGMLGVEVV